MNVSHRLPSGVRGPLLVRLPGLLVHAVLVETQTGGVTGVFVECNGGVDCRQEEFVFRLGEELETRLSGGLGVQLAAVFGHCDQEGWGQKDGGEGFGDGTDFEYRIAGGRLRLLGREFAGGDDTLTIFVDDSDSDADGKLGGHDPVFKGHAASERRARGKEQQVFAYHTILADC